VTRIPRQPRTAIGDLRAMVERCIDCAAEHGDAWETPGTPDHLLVEAAKLMQGLADAMERGKIDFELVEGKPSA
jgi:hypothetical protein